jgi:hypothetical protein
LNGSEPAEAVPGDLARHLDCPADSVVAAGWLVEGVVRGGKSYAVEVPGDRRRRDSGGAAVKDESDV